VHKAYQSAKWEDDHSSPSARYDCSWCSSRVAANKSWRGILDLSTNTFRKVSVLVCSYCGLPTIFVNAVNSNDQWEQVPASRGGRSIQGLPDDVRALHDEARAATTIGAHNSIAMVCRRILMHVAVEKGAAEGLTFAEYVKHLGDGFMPTTTKEWVDRIRTGGNEANHSIALVTREVAHDLLSFTETLLQLIYEIPERMKQK